MLPPDKTKHPFICRVDQDVLSNRDQQDFKRGPCSEVQQVYNYNTEQVIRGRKRGVRRAVWEGVEIPRVWGRPARWRQLRHHLQVDWNFRQQTWGTGEEAICSDERAWIKKSRAHHGRKLTLLVQKKEEESLQRLWVLQKWNEVCKSYE